MEESYKNKYPIILAYGLVVKDFALFKAFGRIEKKLKNEGYAVYTAKMDGFGAIETNAAQLKSYIEKILTLHCVDKVNIIAHSKGGIDSKYMIEHLDMHQHVASLTTICTPHKGSPVSTGILRMPKFLVKTVAFFVNLCYKILGDKRPAALTVCKQLLPQEEIVPLSHTDTIYCQSYSSTIKRAKDNLPMSIPFRFYHWVSPDEECDGLVSPQSAQFGQYKGNCIDGSFSHAEIVDFMTRKSKKQQVYDFYIQICKDLVERGF